MQQHASEDGGEVRTALKALRRGDGEDERQEVEEGVAEGVEDLVGLRGLVNEVARDEQREQGLDHARTGEGRDDGLEDGRERAKERRDGPLLLRRLGRCDSRGSLRIEAGKALDLLAHLGDIRPDDDLELAVLGNHALDAAQGLDSLDVSLGHIDKREAQTRHAVRDAGNVLTPSHQPQDVGGELPVVHVNLQSSVPRTVG